ncbi:hypothetical protein N5J07_00225 [Comamonas aquatica]|uniref:hypothetical protein n=1 Tax=Comamonas aquatica TaxID=225991 RepID=UPI002447F61B|nr:hypothetical protein [Comamonas aquatica]MDH1377898.1 hypothetical protein [Comamonas aquatica]MDH1639025.1 hypothetical protein [Comamonas aquatica]
MSSLPTPSRPCQSSKTERTTLYRLPHGLPYSLALHAGAEVFCASGQLLLQTAPLGGMDGGPSLSLHLHTGQSWRAPCALWLQATALQGPARLQSTLPASPVGPAPSGTAPVPDTVWAHLGATVARWWGQRPLRQRKAQLPG